MRRGSEFGAHARRSVLVAGLLLGAAWAGAAFAPVLAQTAASRSFDIPAGSLSDGITRFGQQSGLQVSVHANMIQAAHTSGVHGAMTSEAALQQLLAGTGFTYNLTDGNTVTLEPSPAAKSGDIVLAPVRVEGQSRRSTTSVIGNLPPAYSGGQVARGGQAGMLGNKDIMDLPFSQTNYTNKTIQDQQARSLGDVLANEPSIITGSKNGGSNEFLEYRGFMSQALSAGNSLNGLAGMAPLQYPSTDYIERVEVLRGPSALLNGASLAGQAALGGTVNLVTKTAANNPLTRLDLRYLSNSELGAHADLGRRFGDHDEFGIRFNGSIDGGETPVATQHADFRTAAVNLDYRGERLRLSLDALNQTSDLTAPSSAVGLGNVLTTLTAIPKAPDNSIALMPSWAWVKHNVTVGMAQGEFDIADNVTVYAAVGTQRYTSSSNAPRVDLANGAGAFTLRSTNYRERYITQSMQGGLRATAVTGPISHALNLNLSQVQWTYGLTPNTCRACSGAGPLVPAGTLYNPVFPTTALTNDPGVFENQSRVVASSIAVADTMSALDDRVQFTAGVRRQRVKSQGLGSRSLTATADTSAWSPSFALVAKPWGHVSLYGSYIENLQPGSVVASTYANAGQAFPPYKSTQYETGAKVDWGNVVTTLALFQISQPSTIPVPSTTGGLPTLKLDGEQQDSGVELNAFGELFQGVRLLGGLTYLDAIRTKTQNGTFDGTRAPGAPKYRAVIGGEVDTPFIDGLTVNGRLTYTSSSVVANSRPDLSVPSWAQVDVGARYSFVGPLNDKPVTVRLNVDNLFDESYWKVMHVVGQIWRSDPRTVRLSASIDF